MIFPCRDAAPSDSLMTNPETRSPVFSVVQFRAASTSRFACVGFGPGAADDCSEMDCRYQYFAENRGMKWYSPGARFRSEKSPSLSGDDGAPSDQTNCGWSLA